MTTRAARNASERRRLARRRAEAMGLPAPEWATARDDDDPGQAPREDRSAEVLRMSATAVAALALERQSMMRREPEPATSTTSTPAPIPDPRWPLDPTRPYEARADDRVRRDGLRRGAAALERVLAVPCHLHDAPPGRGCWELEGHRAACAERMRRAAPTPGRRTTSGRRS